MKNWENEQELRHQFDILVKNQISAIKESINSKRAVVVSDRVNAKRKEKERIERLKVMASQGDRDSFNELIKLDAFNVKNNDFEKSVDPVVFIDWYKSCLENVKKVGTSNDSFVLATKFLYEQVFNSVINNKEFVYNFWDLFSSEMFSNKRSPMVEAFLDIKEGRALLKDVIDLNGNRIFVNYHGFFDFLFFQKKINYYDLGTLKLKNFYASKVFLVSSIANDFSNKLIKKVKSSGVTKDLREKMFSLEYFSESKYKKENNDLLVSKTKSDDELLKIIIELPVSVFNDFYLYFENHKNLSIGRALSVDYSNRVLTDYDLINKLYLSSNGFINLLNYNGLGGVLLDKGGDKRYSYINLNETLISKGVLSKVELVLFASVKEYLFRERLCKQGSGPLFDIVKEIVNKLYSYDDQLLFHWFAKNEISEKFLSKTVGMLDKSGQHYCCYKVLTMFDIRESVLGHENENDIKMAVKNAKFLKNSMSKEFWDKRKFVYKPHTPNMSTGKSVLDYVEACKVQIEQKAVDKVYFKSNKFNKFLIEMDKAMLASVIPKKEPSKKLRSL